MLEVGSEARAALVAVPAALLVVAGAAKLAGGGRELGSALEALGLPRAAARPLAAVELLVGVACLLAPSTPPLIAMATLYASFAAVTVVRLRRGDRAACGCLWGDDESSRTQVAVDLAAAVIAAAGALAPPPSLLRLAADRPELAPALIAGIAVCTICLVGLLRYGGAALGAYSGGDGAS
ncbi:MAG TPA: MauE/DoxX family redox-associated membrane protein [Gaiellales bacterium]|nr:MauE/DoxX family redox-associated membrane protein [Gaiellales bacterium]